MNPIPQHADVAVIGGGPCGALLALQLARAGRQVVLFEARDADASLVDARALALSWASVQCLEQVGAWPAWLDATPIDQVHVSQQDSWGRTLIKASDLDLPHLGMVVDYPAVTRALDLALSGAGVQVRWGCRVTRVQTLARYAELHYQSAEGAGHLSCRLAVLAEGGALIDKLDGITRQETDYRQSALLAHVRTERAQHGVAYERFSRNGPLALLPHGEGHMLVWTRSHADAERLRLAGSELLAQELQQAFGERQGRILSVDSPAIFPLRMRRASRVVARRVALIGNAAQTLHPVAAQGLNLGIRDACGLARALATASDPGSAEALRAYAHGRRGDSRAVIGFTHGLVYLFENHHPLARQARALGMNLLDILPPLRKRLAGHLVFGLGASA